MAEAKKLRDQLVDERKGLSYLAEEIRTTATTSSRYI